MRTNLGEMEQLQQYKIVTYKTNGRYISFLHIDPQAAPYTCLGTVSGYGPTADVSIADLRWRATIAVPYDIKLGRSGSWPEPLTDTPTDYDAILSPLIST